MNRERFGTLLITAGLACAVWPALGWGYGLLSQKQLADEFSGTTPRPFLRIPLYPPPGTEKPTTPALTPVATPPAPASARAARPSPKATGRPARVADAAAKPRPRAKPRRRPAAVPGHAFARLQIDRIGLDTVVVEGVDNRSLRRGPGHLPKTEPPGGGGNCAIAAHRDAWFRRLPEVRVGDPVLVQTRDGAAYEYVVEQKRVVTPDRGDLLDRGPAPRLTLITCTGPGYPRSKYRLLVFCRLRAASPGALLTAAR